MPGQKSKRRGADEAAAGSKKRKGDGAASKSSKANSSGNNNNSKNGGGASSKGAANKNAKNKTAADEAETGNWEDMRDEDGTFKVGAKIFCPYRKDGSYRPCIVIDVQHNSDGSVKYYVHYVEFNRRMDTWIPGPDAMDHDPTGRTRRQDVVEFVEEEYGGSNGMDPDSIREHEEITKVKNVNRIELGRNIIETWYFSPIPREFFPEGSVDVLYVSEFTLDMYRHKSELERHYRRCKIRHPPGDEIYRDDENKLSMFEVDGAKSKIYSQNLSYLAKFFLDHKTLHWDVDPFLFYVLCEYDEKGYHPVGYYSKEKYSEQGYNLACILTLPPYQRKGYGKFLISFSYELSKKEEKVGSPEKPLSDLGQLSYRSYWCHAVLEALLEMNNEAISVIDITKHTSIKTEDVVLALKFLGLTKCVNGRHVICVDENFLREKLKKFPLKGVRVDPERLHWAPLKVDVKRDKWSIKAKRKAEPASFQPQFS
ncbi:Histone acetyltransferase [Hondaea fermentalgiana]|uniref:Histone acetyltransferase n=1 Tax=Hondaea fermentalgiana TaxID=2315210 RepID=A0A2R5G1D0_9STRA|nr:Histone acetyltransferase [Hondaea fermentalgiana]|eukprot:GBG24099.1 Histone acetyltransferase [Hondaea fermentalgiana]